MLHCICSPTATVVNSHYYYFVPPHKMVRKRLDSVLKLQLRRDQKSLTI